MFCLLAFCVWSDLFLLSCLALIFGLQRIVAVNAQTTCKGFSKVCLTGQKSWKRLSGSGHLLLSGVSLSSPILPPAVENLWEVCNENLQCLGGSLSVLQPYCQHWASAYVLGVLSQLSCSTQNVLHEHLVRAYGKDLMSTPDVDSFCA